MFLSAKAASLVPYVPGEQPGEGAWIKLNTNENPYPPSPKALAAIRQAAGEGLRRYPDPECTAVRRALAAAYAVPADQIFVGNGSDEVLALAFQAFFAEKRPVLMPDLTYSFYPVYSDLYNVGREAVPLEADFSLRVEAYRRPNAGIVLANPNAPTGLALSRAEVEELVRSAPDQVVLVDEAYGGFGGESAVPLLERYPNLLVVSTLSKSRSLAGLRVGFAFGSPELIRGLSRVKNAFNSYPVDTLAQAGAAAAVQDMAYFDEICRKVTKTREWTEEAFRDLGFQVLPSRTNFLFVHTDKMEAAALWAALREKRILVRHFSGPRTEGWLRVSIGTPEEMQTVITTTEEILWNETRNKESER